MVRITLDFPTPLAAQRALNALAKAEAQEVAFETAAPVSAPADADNAQPSGQQVASPAAAGAKRRRGRPPSKALPPVEAPTEPAAPAQAEPESMPKASGDPVSVPAEAPPAGTVPQPEAVGQPTMDDAKAALEAVFEKRGFQGAQQLLTTVGAQRLRDVPTEKYSALIAEAAKLAKGE